MSSTLVLFAIIALAMLSAGGAAYAVLYGRISRDAVSNRRIAQFQNRQATLAEKARPASDPAKRRKSVQDSLRDMEERQKAKAKKNASPPLALRLEQAGLSWSKRTFIIISIVCGVVAALAAKIGGLPLYAIAAAGFAAGFGLPRWFVGFARKRRFAKFLNEFPNSVDIIVRGIKAGLPLNDCIRMIATEGGEPVRSEFRMLHEAQAMGLSMADAIGRLPERIPLPEANFFAIVIAIQAKAGGNLSEALGNLSRVLRERKQMKGKIQAMSMEAKASGAIIGALPAIVMVLVFLTSPKYIMLLFTEPMGNVILVCSAVWMLAGILVMRRMINFDI